MSAYKEDKKKIADTDCYYGCCPICNLILVQAKDGMNGFIKCPRCANYIQIVIQDGTVITKKKVMIDQE